MPDIPPWLNTNPQQYAENYARGASLGINVGQAQLGAQLDREKMAQAAQFEQARLSQNTMLKQAELDRQMQVMAIETQQKQAQLAQQAQQFAMEMANKREQLQRDMIIKQQEVNIEKSYRDNLFTLGREKEAGEVARFNEKLNQPTIHSANNQLFSVQPNQKGFPPRATAITPAKVTNQSKSEVISQNGILMMKTTQPTGNVSFHSMKDVFSKLDDAKNQIEQQLAAIRTYPEETYVDTNTGLNKEQMISRYEAELAQINAQRQQKQNEIDALISRTSTSSNGSGNVFATEAEALASGVKGEVIIGGRKARID